MSIIAWIALGLISGFIASRLFSGSGKGLVVDLILGVVGAVVGGAAFHLFGWVGVTGLNLWSVFVAVVGSSLVLFMYHALGRSGNAS
ncbi:MAG: GlsB/YeaQ/YmgE family stress response membrane protein [Deltaproteobacteria bacterium]|nr:GlsB/YeaQ/YmgE family stress response membrane protein [Deltaproteobacteria bacterium]MBK8011771.1 GlsB/YeaQ/YmgE family stress response membrane protein [Deltaproteobacteria bacterium]